MLPKLTCLTITLLIANLVFCQKIGDNFFISGLDETGATSDVVQYPALAYNSIEDEYLVVWAGKYNGNNELDPDESEIWGQLIDAATNTLIGDNFRISDLGPPLNNTYGANAPKVAFNPKYNEYLVVFYGDNNDSLIVNGESEIYGQRLDADGNELGINDFRISTMGDDLETDREIRKKFDGYFPDVVYNVTNDEYMVVWFGDNIDNDLEIWGQRLSGQDGSEIGVDFRVSFVNTIDPFHINDDPTICWNSIDNAYLVTWHGGNFNDKSYQIYGQLMDSTGILLDTTFQISNSSDDEALEAFCTFNKDQNEYLVIWGDEADENQFLIKGQRLDALGQKMDSIVNVSDNGENEIRYLDSQVAESYYDTLGQEYVVVWSGNIAEDGMDADYKVHFITLDGTSAQPIDTAIILSNSSGDVDNNPSPALAFRPVDRTYLVAWTANAPIEVSGQVFETQNYSCTDGIKNGDEEDIDCGGMACIPCITCEDGIQNGDETGIDCGGTCPDACCIVGELCDDGNSNTINDSLSIDCTCVGTAIALMDAKILLEAVFVDSLLVDSFRAKGLIPVQSPYEDSIMISDSALVLAHLGDTSIVDWVEVALRTTSNGTSVVKRSALLRRDGKVVDESGKSPIRFPNVVAGDYFVLIRHRNHLEIMTAEKIRLE